MFDAAPEGAVAVIQRYREGSNLNPQLRRIVARAGIECWPRTWHNLRASRQTELAANYPLHTVCAWIGNTKAIAVGHYLQVTDADWTRAVGGAKSGALGAQNAAQQHLAESRSHSPNQLQVFVNKDLVRDNAKQCCIPHKDLMGRAGLEPATLAFSVRCSTN